ncbi:LppU/SCO3897 family protein [Micromonospora aurantiaca (nom. illeg.)]|uniref:LppU/SCO3897 family protein n=1 Tax=Micromonospora aurantiaca (nom. illeg.) TaxID=47850 RepID=UPI00379B9D09
MTSEAPHRPGQEPGEVSPGTGGPVPYGDQPAQQDNGYNGAPDLGWAPPPPAGRPAQPAPAWAANDDQPPAWAPPAGQPVTGRATAQVPQPAWGGNDQGNPAWAGSGGPSWGNQEQSGPDRGAEQAPPAWAATPPGSPAEPSQAPWAAEQNRPGWGSGEQPGWSPSGDPAARGTGYVPAPATVPNETWITPAPADDPHRSGGFAPTGGQHEDASGRAGGWAAAQQQDDPNRSGGWNPRDEQPAASDDPNRSGGWNPRESQPAWAPGQQTGATWPPADPPARAAAAVSVPGAARPDNAWSTPEQSDQDNRSVEDSGGWRATGGPQHDEGQRSGGWPAPQAENRSGGWDEPARTEDPDRSGGWAAGRAASPAEAAQPGGWEPNQSRQAGGWGDGTAVPQQRDSGEQAGAWSGAASVPQQHEPGRPSDEPAQPAWGAAAPAEARASVSVPSPDAPAGWGGNQDERPAAPSPEPWSPAEAWGRSEDSAPAYQPAPAPGISPGNAVPLPAQQQRVPGAALAASSPADHPGPEPQGYEPERGDGGWNASRPEEPQSPAVPGPRTSPEGGPVSASASVPVASRVTPPSDQPLPTSGPAPQPRVYGRPARPEPDEAPEQDESGFPGQDGPHGNGFPGPQSRSEDADGPHGYAGAPSSPAAPPSFPVGVPSFVDTPGNTRPANGVHPGGEQPDSARDPFGGPQSPYGAPGGQDAFGGPGGRPDPFGAPGGQQDAFGGPGQQDPFGGPGGQQAPFGSPAGRPEPFGEQDRFGPSAGGRASVAVPGQGPAGGGNAFPPPPQQAPPAWSQDGPGTEPEQGRFDAFKPDAAESQTEAPPPKVRNGRVLAAVLIAAVLILAVPLGLLTLLGKVGDDKSAGFDPAVGSCVKQSGTSAVAADCGEPGAFSVVSKVDNKDKCADLAQPSVSVESGGTTRVLCLKPAGQ